MELSFDMPATRMYANSSVRQDAGCIALMRGPIVYCIEGVDNGEKLQELHIPRTAEITVGEFDEAALSGIVPLKIEGVRVRCITNELYSDQAPIVEPAVISAIPYYAWSNRGLNQMKVWIPEY